MGTACDPYYCHTVIAAPEYRGRRGYQIWSNIGYRRSATPTRAALGPISSVFAAGADEVSASIAALFGSHAQVYQALSAQAAQHSMQQFVQLMNGGASAVRPHRGR